MAEEIQIEIVAPSDGHGAMPFRLGDIELDKKFGDLHPLLDSVDRLRKEWKFQFKLIRHEWGQAHFLTMLTGLLAFLLGSISGELFGGGDAKVSGIEGITSLSGFVFFQLIVSSILWVWFFIQITVNFPIMRGHIINVIIIWCSLFASQIILHVNSPSFPAGADLGMIFMMSVEQEYKELDIAIKYFQETMMKLRYSNIPTIASPHGLTLGGGCELCMHADKVVAAAETYIGLVEFGVGLIPGGGGTKEMTLRTSESFKKNDVELNISRENFLNIAMAKVSESAYQAFGLGIFQKEKDYVVVENKRLLGIAKQEIINIANRGYTKPIKNKEIKVLGKQSLGMFYVGSDSMMSGNYISKHDKKIANKLAYVMSGGDLSEPSYVSEDYLLEIEREAFLSLCGEKKTLERIEYMLKTGKPLRN